VESAWEPEDGNAFVHAPLTTGKPHVLTAGRVHADAPAPFGAAAPAPYGPVAPVPGSGIDM